MANQDHYLNTQVLTADPVQLHLMVVDAALRSARKGLAAMEAEDREQSYFSLDESRKLVSELISGLDPEHAPDIVRNLKSLFVFVFRNLSLGEIERDEKKVRDAIHILDMHRETWVTLIGQTKSAPQSPVPSPSFARKEPAAPARGKSWSA